MGFSDPRSCLVWPKKRPFLCYKNEFFFTILNNYVELRGFFEPRNCLVWPKKTTIFITKNIDFFYKTKQLRGVHIVHVIHIIHVIV